MHNKRKQLQCWNVHLLYTSSLSFWTPTNKEIRYLLSFNEPFNLLPFPRIRGEERKAGKRRFSNKSFFQITFKKIRFFQIKYAIILKIKITLLLIFGLLNKNYI